MEWALFFFFVYVLIVVVIGLVASRKESEDDFMIAGRKVAGFQVATTMSAGFFDGSVLAIYLAYLYKFGFSAIWLFIGLALGFLLLRKYAWRIKQMADRHHVYSMPEYFATLFGPANGLAFSFLLILQFFLLLIVNLIISGQVLASLFGLPQPVAVAIGGGIILTYLLLAGFKAVVRTDLFQVLIMVVMCLTVALALGREVPITTSDFNLTELGLGNIVGFLVLTGLGLLVAPDLWQRIFATKDEANLKRGLGYAAMILPALAIVLSVIGLATRQAFPEIAPESALVTGFSHLLPIGLKELGLILLYAVSLSSSDTVTFVVSSIVTRDLKNYTRSYSEASMKKLMRCFMVAFVLLAVVIGSLYQDILALGFSLASLNLTLVPVVFASFYWQLKPTAVFGSLTAGFLGVVGLFAAGQLSPETAIISVPIALAALVIGQFVFRGRHT